MFDYSKLKGKIKEVFDIQSNYAKALGLSETSVTNKLNNITNFTQTEIYETSKLLSISKEEIGLYFFTEKVEK